MPHQKKQNKKKTNTVIFVSDGTKLIDTSNRTKTKKTEVKYASWAVEQLKDGKASSVFHYWVRDIIY